MDRNPYLDGTPDEFIEKNLGLARHIAWKYVKSRKDRDPDDILSVANLGLVKAYQGFNPEGRTGQDGKEITFASYAASTIHGFIMTFLRVDRPIRLGRRAIDLIAKINSAGLIGNETIEEIAIKAGISTKEATEAVMASVAVNTDSMDREIVTEDGNITLGDMFGKCDEINEIQEIVDDFVTQLPPKLKEIYRLRIVGEKTQREIADIMGLSRSYITKLEEKLMKTARQYGEVQKRLEVEDMGREMSPETKLMREEIDTFAKFGTIGTYEDVANKYGVGKSTAYAWMKKLMDGGETKKVEEVAEIKETKMEGAPLEIPNTPENYQVINEVAEVTERVVLPLDVEGVDECAKVGEVEPEREYTDCFGQYHASCELTPCERIGECSFVKENTIKKPEEYPNDSEPCASLLCHSCEEGGCVKLGGRDNISIATEDNFPSLCYERYGYDLHGCSRNKENGCNGCDELGDETKNDLEGLEEPEPKWTPPIVRNGRDYKSGEYTSDDELWEIVAKDLVHLRKRAIEVAVVTANRDFDERINQILGGK